MAKPEPLRMEGVEVEAQEGRGEEADLKKNKKSHWYGFIAVAFTRSLVYVSMLSYIWRRLPHFAVFLLWHTLHFPSALLIILTAWGCIPSAISDTFGFFVSLGQLFFFLTAHWFHAVHPTQSRWFCILVHLDLAASSDLINLPHPHTWLELW